MKYRLLLFLSMFLTGIPFPSKAQEESHAPALDSTVVINGDTTIITYFQPKFSFGDVVPLHGRNRRNKSINNRRGTNTGSISIHAVDTAKAVGSIPFEEGTTPSGGKTYSIPIMTSSHFTFAPQVAITYNSQSGEGRAGYGWDISGLSSITVISKSLYYHGTVKAADRADTTACYALDGEPLVANDLVPGHPECQYVTARSKVLVRRVNLPSGCPRYFEALLPDGTKAIYGDTTNTYPRASYLLSERTDAVGYKIRYLYCTPRENGYIDRIEYGYLESGTPAACLDFHYTMDQVFDHPPRYYAGETSHRDRHLSSVVSRFGNEELRTYSFQYDNQYSFEKKDILCSVQCRVGQEWLNPLRFEYNIDSIENGTAEDFEQSDSTFLLKKFNPEKDDFIYKRGKFSKTSSKDGLIIYPERKKYAKLKTWSDIVGAYGSIYGSMYQWDQKILVFPDIENSCPPVSINADMGFQTIEAVDTDGDGTDEIIKLNTKASYSNGVNLNIQKCSFNPALDSLKVILDTIIRVPGTFREMGFWNPVQREYFFGDFLGLGRDQLLTAAFSTDSLTGPYITIIDLMDCSVLSQRSVFLLQDKSIPHMVSADMDSDGRMELYVPETDCLKRLDYNERFNEMVLSDSVCDNLYLEQFESNRIRMGDFNGDGYLDFIAARRYQIMDTDSLFINDGKAFHTYEIELERRGEKEEVYYEDINKDGLTDIVTVSNDSLFFYINRNQVFAQERTLSSLTIPSYTVVMPGSFRILHDTFDLVAIQDSIMVMYKFGRDYVRDRLLTQLDNGNGVVRRNTYGDLASAADGTYSETASRTYSTSDGYQKLFAPLYLLKKEETYTDSTTVASSVSHYYTDAAYNSKGLGFCSFGKISTTDNISGIRTEQTFDPEKMGMPTKTVTRLDSTKALIDSTLLAYEATYSGSRKFNFRLTDKDSFDILNDVTTHETYSDYDAYDFPKRVLTVTEDFDVDSVWRKESLLSYVHWARDGEYHLGLPSTTYVTDYGMHGDSTCRRHSVAYNADLLPTYVWDYACEYANRPGMEEYDAEEVQLGLTRMDYDSLGRMTRERSAPLESFAFVTKTYTYGNTPSSLPESSTDEYGRTTTYLDYDKYGNPHRVCVDSLGWTTRFSFDQWGRRTGVRHHDGTRDTTVTSWGGIGLYKVWTRMAGQPETIVHYDRLGRKIRQSDRRFDGCWRHVDTEYDEKGQVARVSLPFKGNSPSQWTSYHYDEYGRVDTLTNANGRKDVTEYFPRDVTTTVNGVTRRVLTNPLGKVRYVDDDATTVRSMHRADGQVDTVWIYDSGRAYYEYDFIGRRTKSDVTGAGVHTYAYAMNDTTGVQTLTHTSPEGTVITKTDKYGRTIRRENVGDFTTEWSYSGELLMSEVSTNGTRKDYTYDGYERVSSAKETGFDGKWLKQNFTYGNDNDGSLVSTLIICDTDTLGTERYYYENGYKTITSFLPYNAASPNDTIIVWKLTQENGMGLPTEGRSAGNIQRTYSYDAYGRQTGRTLGSVMNFGYTYDINDNLASRSDNLRNLSESFTYDSLDRLTGAGTGNRSRSYADNGNVTADSAVGAYLYNDSTNPYRQTGTTQAQSSPFDLFDPSVTMNSFSRPATLLENNGDMFACDFEARFAYDGDYSLLRIQISYPGEEYVYSVRHFLGGRYEYYSIEDGWEVDEILYLGGDAKTAPVAFRKRWYDYDEETSEGWIPYNIGRDNLGSPVALVDEAGSLVSEASYDPWGNSRRSDNWAIVGYCVGGILDRGFTGHIIIPEFWIYHCGARLYDSQTGRFLGYDPVVQDPDNSQNWNRYSYCLNNPFRYTDPSGEFVFSIFLGPIGAYLDAACWGALIGGASYALNVAFSDGGFDNWDWGELGKAAGFGALSGVATFGIGEAFGALGNFAGKFGTELIRGVAHGTLQGGMSAIQGGNFWGGFVSGTLGSWSASGTAALGIDQWLGTAGRIGVSTMTGGIGTAVAGEGFWKGAAIGLTTSTLNHLQHESQKYNFFARLRRHYERGDGEMIELTRYEFEYLTAKGKMIKTIGEDENHVFTAYMDFYKSNLDLALSFGTSTVKYTISGDNVVSYQGFYDRYDFNAMIDQRGWIPELLTRIYGTFSSGTPFDIYFNKQIF